MDLQIIDPLADPRWAVLAATHPKASVFHQVAWLEALVRTYNYKVFAITSTPIGQPLRDGIVVCEVASWITGTRAVSLPFSDHCQPLVDDEQLSNFLHRLISESDPRHWKYVELRPRAWDDGSRQQFSPSQSYCFHRLDLTQPIDRLFHNLHRDSIQRKIHRAEREGVQYETGSSADLLNDFYSLLLLTRKRHHVPAQPLAWFQNLLQTFGENARIRIARKDNIPIAAILTLRHRDAVVYKYGCSDEKWHNLGGMPFLFWNLIKESKASGAEELDFGRSDTNNEGLVTFKDRFGTERTTLTYFRYPSLKQAQTNSSWIQRSAGRFFSLIPNSLMPAVGRILYRHIG